jgi:type I restriction enzyme M protein
LIARISEDILERFATLPLLHSYDVYQRLMDYWAETMQDDVFLIGSDGWTEAAKPRLAIDNKERKIKETPDLVVGRKRYKMDLIPPALIVARYFAAEQEKVDALEAKREEAERAIEEFVEENGGEDGLLDDAKTENGSVTKASVKEQLTKLPDTLGNREERAVLAECLKRIEIESEASREQRDAQAELDARVLMKYGELSTIEIKTLVVEDKWMDALYKAMEEEIERITRTLANRVQELEDRYAETLARVEADVDKLGARVTDHLRAMGMVLA